MVKTNMPKSVWNFGAALFFIAFVFIVAPAQTEAANILGIFGATMPSHLIVNMAVLKTLADRGHNVTLVTALDPKLKHPNITSIVLPPSEEQQKTMANKMRALTEQKTSLLWSILPFTDMILKSQCAFITNERLQQLTNNPDMKYDVIIWGYFINKFQLGIAAKFNAPIIVNSVGVPMIFTDALVGNIRDPSYVPNMEATLAAGEVMSFWKRTTNWITSTIIYVVHVMIERRMESTYNEVFANESADFPTYHESLRRVSLLFNNYHAHSEGPIRPTSPQSIEIGGIQIKEQPDPLPQDIDEFLNAAKDGAIFFSLGTNIKGSYVKPESIVSIFNVLSSLKQRVIWKWEDLDKTPGAAPNILYNKWLPQDDILAHPNTKLFITHAGKGSIAESQYHGVPMVALPVFGDQPGNAANMVASGFGQSLDMLELTEDELKATIHEVLYNSSYAKRVKKFSQLYRDRPLTARESVVFWTEYVIRHNGALHLQTPVVRMNFIESNNLDVYALLLFMIYISFKAIKFSLKFVYRKVFNRTQRPYQLLHRKAD